MREKKIKFRVLGRAIIVLKPAIEEDTVSGIYKGKEVLAAEAKLTNSTFLEVLAVGNEVTKITIGDMILVDRAPIEVTIDDVVCGYVYEPSVVGIKEY